MFSLTFFAKNLSYDRVDTSERLLKYIWDNYIAYVVDG